MDAPNDVTTTTSVGNNSRALSEAFSASEAVNLTMKSGSSHQHHNRQHKNEKFTSLGSLLGMPVKFSNGIADKKHNHTYIYKGSLGI